MPGPKRRTYEILVDPPEGDLAANAVSIGILVLIAMNVVVSVAETEQTLADAYPRFFYWFEVVSVAVFTAEYLGRLWSCTVDERYAGAIRGRLRMAREPMAVIDFVAIAPFYLQALMPGLDLRFVRALRLFRLFRVFKVGRYAESFLTLAAVLRSKREELAISVVIVLISITLAASAMWLCEQDAQPGPFRSVPSAMWWAIITITTIGYGDVYPVTAAGKIVGGIVAFLGICVFALPVGIIGSGFIDELNRQKEEKARKKRCTEPGGEPGPEAPEPSAGLRCPHCGGQLLARLVADEDGDQSSKN